MTDDLDLLALAEKSAENDLAFLIRAKEDTKRLMKQSPSQDNIAAFKRAKAAVADEVARLQHPCECSKRSWTLRHSCVIKGSKFRRVSSTVTCRPGKWPRTRTAISRKAR